MVVKQVCRFLSILYAQTQTCILRYSSLKWIEWSGVDFLTPLFLFRFAMQFYEISDEYINYLRNTLKQTTVYDSEVDSRRHNRKYIPLFRYKGISYFAPLSHGKKKDYNYNAKTKSFKVKCDTQVCIYIKDRNNKSLGTIQLGNLIPVPTGEYKKYELDAETDRVYKQTVKDQLHFIASNIDRIREKAKNIVVQKMAHLSEPIKTIDKVPDIEKIHLYCEKKNQFAKLQDKKSAMQTYIVDPSKITKTPVKKSAMQKKKKQPKIE